jgi:hypothetical protein
MDRGYSARIAFNSQEHHYREKLAMTTVTVQIGNGDNKLSQGEWSKFVGEMRQIIQRHVRQIHFQGGSDWDAPWQNACWVGEVSPEQMPALKAAITRRRIPFKQDAAAISVGEAKFI